MAELINKKDAIQQIKSIPYSTQEEVFFMSAAVSRLRKMPTVEGFDDEKYEKLVIADMERKHSENQQLLSELKAVFPTTTEAEIRASAYERFSIEAVRQFIKFDEEHDFISIGVCLDIISKVAEQLKEE